MSPTAGPPLLDLVHLAATLDRLRIGRGEVTAEPIGQGHSNLTYRVSRGRTRVVLRRPPRPPYPPSAHDVVREARIQQVAHEAGLPVPRVLAIVEDGGATGAPYVVSELVDGIVLDRALPPSLADPRQATVISCALVDTLADIHAIDPGRLPGGRGDSSGPDYVDRQIRRFSGIWNGIGLRAIGEMDALAEWLSATRPPVSESTLVHGDYRLGNAMFAAAAPTWLMAILDWELAAAGDPLADLGYMLATWAQADDPETPMLALSGASRAAGFLTRRELVGRYARRSGRDVSALPWYVTLAEWKAAVFLEASYARYRAGTAQDPYFATLETGVPAIARAALARIDAEAAAR